CGLGQSAPNSLLSTLRFFRDEYEAHIKERRCPAGVCEMTEVPTLELVEELYRRAALAQTSQEVA
ncbi:MAG: NADH-quinone oxidoreductase subunit L, partial [Syntrophobacteraceae bacterium]|nr:NADH-quinone oxidoreductase subunit L [Syntrophobacteraceae bacterium]